MFSIYYFYLCIKYETMTMRFRHFDLFSNSFNNLEQMFEFEIRKMTGVYNLFGLY